VNKRKQIENTVKDLVSSLLYYDRKECDHLKPYEIEEAIARKEISIDEIVYIFDKELRDNV